MEALIIDWLKEASTLDRYTHVSLGDKVRAIEALPRLGQRRRGSRPRGRARGLDPPPPSAATVLGAAAGSQQTDGPPARRHASSSNRSKR